MVEDCVSLCLAHGMLEALTGTVCRVLGMTAFIQTDKQTFKVWQLQKGCYYSLLLNTPH